MKKLTALLLAAVCMLSLAACGQNPSQVHQAETVVVETAPPSPIVEVTAPPTSAYPVPTVTPLPTTVPTTIPTTVPTAAPAPTATPRPVSTPVQTPRPTAAPTAAPAPKDYKATATDEELKNAVDGYINGQGVNFRVGPGSGYKIIKSYPKGTKLLIIAIEGDWTRVKLDDRIGYVFSKYVSVSKPIEDGSADIIIETPTPTTAPTATPEPTASPEPTATPEPTSNIIFVP